MTEDDPVSNDPEAEGPPQSRDGGDTSGSEGEGDPPGRDDSASRTQNTDHGESSGNANAVDELTDTSERADRPSENDGTVSSHPAAQDQGRPDADANIDRQTLLTGSKSIDGRVRYKWGLRIAFLAGIIGVIVGATSVFGLQWGPFPGVGAFVVVAVAGIGYVLLLYRSWQYEIRADALYLERGVFTHVKTVVPFVRVQHIDTSRDPVDRAIGLSSLVVYTAGSRGADVTIPGLTPGEAEDLQSRLKVLAKESTGDDAV